ncbi:hypothetical protein PI124_g17800 [Phytophthora idaei]|nr:hypothetical protein PI125_g18486 [Phytophthora idaei]KAG3138262.1 hypothetical protein PI126_g16999 [Phytophthora idaei]KAG3237209.1 hypothetical protein PI124_g17800 [Phytophthora idaei]
MSVGELLNPPEENVLMEDPTDEDFCPVETNFEYDVRNQLSSVDATGEDDEDAADSTPAPENLSAEGSGWRSYSSALMRWGSPSERLLGFGQCSENLMLTSFAFLLHSVHFHSKLPLISDNPDFHITNQ